MRNAKSLAQLKIDARNAGWPWPIERPHDERALVEGCRVDFAAAERVRTFYEVFLRVPKSAEEIEATGSGMKPFELLQWWYRDVLGPIFGWKRPDGRRRFNRAFVTTGKKSGKSTVLSGLPPYMICADGEEEAEAYSAAVDRDQASIIYRKASRCVKDSPHLSRILRRIDSQKRIVHHATGSWYEAIASDADSADGKNPHLLIVDELHRWRDKEFFNALIYGDIARRQPLFFIITTAGDDMHSVGYEEYEYAKRLLDGEHYSMAHFAFIAEAAPEREWDDPEGWLEANPGLREGFGNVQKLQENCDAAKQTPRKIREFQRFICNRWVDCGEDPWLSRAAWDACGDPRYAWPEAGTEVWLGLDLATVQDVAALAIAWWVGELLALAWRLYLPADNLKDREEAWRVPLRQWAKDGWLTLTTGNSIDYAWIRRDISGVVLDERGQPVAERFAGCLEDTLRVQAVAYDPWNASQLVTELGEYDGLPVIEFRQGYATLNTPSKEFERRVASGRIRHGGNPAAAWMVGNCVVDIDPAGNIKPNKKKSRLKIDAVVAAIMASALAIRDGAGDEDGSPGNPVELI